MPVPILDGLVTPTAEKSTLLVCVLRSILVCELATPTASEKIISGQTPGLARSTSRRHTCPRPSEPRPVVSKNIDFIGLSAFVEALSSRQGRKTPLQARCYQSPFAHFGRDPRKRLKSNIKFFSNSCDYD